MPAQTQGGIPSVTTGDMETGDPARLNRALYLLATKIHAARPNLPNMSGFPRVTADDLKNNSPINLNSTLRLFSTQLIQLQAASGKPPRTLNGLPAITSASLAAKDPEPINYALNLIASQVHDLG